MSAMAIQSPSMSLRPSAAGAEAYDLMVHGDIGESWWSESVSAKSVVSQLRALPSSVKSLNIRVNSFGGSVADGLAIYNAIREFKGAKKTFIDGVAISAGSLIAMAGDEVVAPATSLVMIHAPWSGTSGNAQDMRKTADVLDKWAEAMVTAYTRKTGKSAEEIRTMLTDGEDHWYTAEEAVAAGFVDSIIDDESVTTSAKALLDRAPSAMRFAALAAFRGVTPPLNQLTPPKEVPVVEVPQTEVPVEAQADYVQARVDAAVQAAVAAAVAKVEAEAQARVSEAQAQVVEAQARAAAEVEAREIRDAVDAATKAFAHIPVAPDELGRALRAATKAAPEAAAVLDRVLKAADAALKASVLTTPVGVAANTESTPEDRLESLVKAKREADPKLTAEAARVMVYTENADIVAALRGEKD